MVETKRDRTELKIEATKQMAKKASMAGQLRANSGLMQPRSIGNIKNAVRTAETRYPEISFPQRICQEEMVVVRSKSSVWRSRSPVMAPAVKTGAVRILKIRT